jgi:hypothetical protein
MPLSTASHRRRHDVRAAAVVKMPIKVDAMKQERCTRCAQPISLHFRMLGLATYETTLVYTPDGPTLRVSAIHTYPCVGKPTRLRELLAVFVQIINTQGESNG